MPDASDRIHEWFIETAQSIYEQNRPAMAEALAPFGLSLPPATVDIEIVQLNEEINKEIQSCSAALVTIDEPLKIQLDPWIVLAVANDKGCSNREILESIIPHEMGHVAQYYHPDLRYAAATGEGTLLSQEDLSALLDESKEVPDRIKRIETVFNVREAMHVRRALLEGSAEYVRRRMPQQEGQQTHAHPGSEDGSDVEFYYVRAQDFIAQVVNDSALGPVAIRSLLGLPPEKWDLLPTQEEITCSPRYQSWLRRIDPAALISHAPPPVGIQSEAPNSTFQGSSPRLGSPSDRGIRQAWKRFSRHRL